MADFPALSSDRTNWRREFAAPMRSFLRTEAGSSGVLAAAIVVALLWANLAAGLVRRVSGGPTSRSSSVDQAFGLDLREWINSGLMTLFFLVVGLEARREFDLGDLRERSRFVLPVLAGICRDGRAGADLPRLQRRRPTPRTAGVWRCRPTPRSRSGCSRWSVAGCRIASGSSC